MKRRGRRVAPLSAESNQLSSVLSPSCFRDILQSQYLQEARQNLFPEKVKVAHFADKGRGESVEGQNLIGLPYIRQIRCDLSSKGKGLQFCLLPPIYFQESCQYVGIRICIPRRGHGSFF